MAAIQVRDVPDELHEALRERARAEGVSLGTYVLEALRRDLRRPRLDEWADQHQRALEAAGIGQVHIDAADAVRRGRDERDEQLAR